MQAKLYSASIQHKKKIAKLAISSIKFIRLLSHQNLFKFFVNITFDILLDV